MTAPPALSGKARIATVKTDMPTHPMAANRRAIYTHLLIRDACIGGHHEHFRREDPLHVEALGWWRIGGEGVGVACVCEREREREENKERVWVGSEEGLGRTLTGSHRQPWYM